MGVLVVKADDFFSKPQNPQFQQATQVAAVYANPISGNECLV